MPEARQKNQNTAQARIEKLLLSHKDEIIAIAEKHGAYNIRVFGSVARGEATESSDLDLLIDYDRAKKTPWFPAGLILELEDLLAIPVDIGTELQLKKEIRDRVLSEAIAL